MQLPIVKSNLPQSRKVPVFNAISGEKQLIDSFILAVTREDFTQADGMLSRWVKDSCSLDYKRLHAIFSSCTPKPVSSLRYYPLPRSIGQVSLYLGGDLGILHIFTVIEPDRQSRFKICGLERE